VLQLLGQGLAPREIAARLHRSTKTIEAHRENIKRKLGLRSATEVVQRAAQLTRQTP
jgi:DNA-binding NarL/FixJ family response regulator